MERGRPDAAPERVLAAMVQQAPASSCGMQPGNLLAPPYRIMPYRSALSAHQAHLCWGAQLCKTDRCPLIVPKSAAFRDRFCAACREGSIIVPCCRIRVLDSSLPAPKNSRAEGMWNLEGRTNPPFWPPHRVINQTADTCGLRLIVLRDETSAPLQGLAPLPAEFGSEIAFLVRRTLVPVPTPGMPAQLIHALRGMGQSGTLANNANVSGADPSSSLLRFGSSGDESIVAMEEASFLPPGTEPAATAAGSSPLGWHTFSSRRSSGSSRPLPRRPPRGNAIGASVSW